MFVLRNLPKGARFAPFGLGLCVFALMPTEIGYQDIASLLARQPGVAERWQKRVFSSAGTIQVATFSFGRPIGTSSPQTATYRLASLDNQGIDITGSVTRNPLVAPPPRYHAADFPKVDRTLKGDRLIVTPPPAETATPAESRAGDRGPRDIEQIGQGRQDRRDGAVRRARAARSRAAGRAERAAAGAIRIRCRSKPDLRTISRLCRKRARPRAPCAAARWFLLQDLEPVLWFVARLAGEHRALAAR